MWFTRSNGFKWYIVLLGFRGMNELWSFQGCGLWIWVAPSVLGFQTCWNLFSDSFFRDLGQNKSRTFLLNVCDVFFLVDGSGGRTSKPLQKAQILPESGRAVQNAIVKQRRPRNSSELSCKVVLTSLLTVCLHTLPRPRLRKLKRG